MTSTTNQASTDLGIEQERFCLSSISRIVVSLGMITGRLLTRATSGRATLKYLWRHHLRPCARPRTSTLFHGITGVTSSALHTEFTLPPQLYSDHVLCSFMTAKSLGALAAVEVLLQPWPAI
jgi:hypothetical protein